MKWEYLIIEDDQLLPRLGNEGWELVSTVYVNQQLKLYLKKPAPHLKERITREQRDEVYKRLGLEG